jgi:hypothetical protein
MSEIITTQTTTTNDRSGIGLSVGSSVTNYNLGNFVTDVSLQPFIRSRIISFRAVNMRPGKLVHVFFDNVLVDAYCAPAQLSNPQTSTNGQLDFDRTGNWGDPITVGANGQVFGQFNIPDAVFRVGERTLELADVTNLATGSDSITTLASATFTGSAISVTRQGVTLTTVNPEIRTMSLSDTNSQTVTNVQNIADNVVYNPDNVVHIPGKVITNYEVYEVPVYNPDPLAQTFQIKTPSKQQGLFVTDIKVYFKAKAVAATANGAVNGISIYICDTLNGYPNSNSILPYSKVHLDASSVNVSADGSLSTTFTFDSPIFCATDTYYAFVIVPDNSDPDYQIFTAKLGDLDVASGVQVSSIPASGNLFLSGNQSAWTSVPDEFMKYDMNIAIFNQSSGTAKFTNKNLDFLSIDAITYANSRTVRPGDMIYYSSNTTPSTVNTSIYGTVSYYNNVAGRMYVENSSGLFSANTTFQVHRHVSSADLTNNTTTLVATGTIGGFIRPRTNAVVPRFASISPSGTTLSYSYSGYGNTGTVDGTTVSVVPETDTEFLDYERRIFGRSEEVSVLSGAKSVSIACRMATDSPLVSPVIDLVRSKVVSVGNLINGTDANIYDEFYNYGVAASKYISPPITLAAGQDAEDLKVILSAYRPLQSDILVYAKFLNAQDAAAIADKTWTLLINQASSLYSDFRNVKDFREFTFSMANAIPNTTISGVTISVNTSSTTVTGNGTSFTSYLAVNRYIQVGSDVRRISAISNNTVLTVDSAFSTANTAAYLTVVAPPTTAYIQAESNTVLSGTFAVSNATNVVTGTGTNFINEVKTGDILWVTGADTKRVVAVTNATSLIVENAFAATVSGAAGSIVTNAGLTYADKNSANYTTFKTFQLKIVLLSDNSARVPHIDDVRCLALQL